jgi:hypothetical protein
LDVGLSGAGSGPKLSTLEIGAAYLSLATRLRIVRFIIAAGILSVSTKQTCSLAVKQSLDTLSSSFFLQSSVLINLDAVQANLNLGSSVGGDDLSLG